MRLSSAKNPDSSGTTPGMGVKFFRDGRPSANFVAMYSLDGQPCTDPSFFSNDWTNHIPLTDNFGLKIIAAKFWQASFCPLQVGLSDLASSDDGVGTFPYMLKFHSLVDSPCDCTKYAECLQTLISKLPVGTKLFEVSAQSAPSAAFEDIGSITITDAMTTSKFGDEQLFFRHQHMEDDFKIKPEWLASIDRATECGMGCTGTAPPPIEKGCSSPFNTSIQSKVSAMLQDDIDVTV
jgi:hypothetical protein